MQPLPSPNLKMELSMSAMIHFILSYLILFIGVYLLYIVVFLEWSSNFSVLTYLSVLGGEKNLLAKKFWCRNKSLSNWILWIFMAGSTNSPGLGLLWNIKFICNSILSYKGHIKWKYKRNKLIEAPDFTVFRERGFLTLWVHQCESKLRLCWSVSHIYHIKVSLQCEFLVYLNVRLQLTIFHIYNIYRGSLQGEFSHVI